MTLLFLIIIALLIYYFYIYKRDGFGKSGLKSGKKCPNCHTPVEESYNVCPTCKETLLKKCPGCGEKIDALWMFCPYCERTVGKRGEE